MEKVISDDKHLQLKLSHYERESDRKKYYLCSTAFCNR